jgi:DNA repair protein RadC
LVALVIGPGAGRRRPLDVADEILARFDGLVGLRRAAPEELASVRGLGTAKSAALLAALELGRRAATLEPARRPVIRSPQDAADVARRRLETADQESFCVLLLNARHELIGFVEASKGGLNAAAVDARDAFREAVRRGAHAVILAHNHPSGNPEPSPEDARLTAGLREGGAVLGIRVLDHVIVGDGRFVSLRERGLGF